MDKSSFKKVSAFIEEDSRDLRIVFEKVRLLGQLNRKVLRYLEPNLAQFCEVANLQEGVLTLIVANGSVATQLRFQKTDLIKKFHDDALLKHITSIECKVRPPQSTLPPGRLNTNSSTNMSHLSQETGDMMREIAESISDPKLSEVMMRIAGRVKKEVDE